MKLISQGEEILWESFRQVQSLTDYCASLEVRTNFPIGGPVEVSDGKVSVECIGTGYRTEEGKFVTVLRPKVFVDMAEKVLPPFKGEFTTEALLQQVGFNVISVLETDKVYWEFPSLPFKKFIDHLEMHTQITNGGGCFINFTMDGNAQISDLKSMANREDVTSYLLGSFNEMEAEFLWMFDYPGSYTLIQHMNDQTIEREIVFEEGFGHGVITEIITNDKLKDMTVRFLRNRFYRRFYYKHQTSATAINGNPNYLSAPVRIKNLTSLVSGIVKDNSTKAVYSLIF